MHLGVFRISHTKVNDPEGTRAEQVVEKTVNDDRHFALGIFCLSACQHLMRKCTFAACLLGCNVN